ncbi:hypothetical protein [Acidobacterium sp. S8]|uniref:hypothetical protein n=1 Tax=Acidobacterium sp. S8 TaxID=1641854 RepID=UPI001C2057F2|nr:hypothetical protein [Acidobacterium sp. S8]
MKSDPPDLEISKTPVPESYFLFGCGGCGFFDDFGDLVSFWEIRALLPLRLRGDLDPESAVLHFVQNDEKNERH